MKYTYLFWLFGSIIPFAVGEFLSKKFSLDPNPYLAFGVVLSYACGSALWLPAICQRQSLTIAGTIWAVLSVLATITVGTVVFGEHIGMCGKIGVLFALTAIILLNV
jgi:multidrug transporter EmrE-like cation transporter